MTPPRSFFFFLHSETRQTGWRGHQSDTSYTEYCWRNNFEWCGL